MKSNHMNNINDNNVDVKNHQLIKDNQDYWICPKCNLSVSTNNDFCPFCGFKFEETNKKFEDVEVNHNKDLKQLNS